MTRLPDWYKTHHQADIVEQGEAMWLSVVSEDELAFPC
jgi:hypothetical protein